MKTCVVIVLSVVLCVACGGEEDRESGAVPDEAQLTLRLEESTGETHEVKIWQNDARDGRTLQPLLQELKIRIAESYGVQPIS